MDNAPNDNPTTWRDTLPEGVKDNPSIQNFENVEALASAYINAKSLQGQSIRIPSESASEDARKEFVEKLSKAAPNLVQLPGDDAPDDAWDDVFKKLGKPEQYDVPDEAKHLSHLKDLAEAGKLTKRQYKALFNKAVEADRVAREHQNVQKATWHQELVNQWGPSKDAKVARVGVMLAQQGAPQEFQDAVKAGGVPPSMMVFLDKVADTLGGEGQNSPDGGNPELHRMTPDTIEREIQDIVQNPDYRDPASPRQKFLMKRMLELQGMRA